jgi:uncharacterized protein (TIGR03437 family)
MIVFRIPVLLVATHLLLFAQPTLQFPVSGLTPLRAIPQANGNTLFVGTSTTQGGIVLWSSAASSGVIGGVSTNSGAVTPLDATMDPSGNVWIVGTTTAYNFPVVNPILAQNTHFPYGGGNMGFVVEYDPVHFAVKFATYLGGTQPKTAACYYCATSATAIASDSSGNIYVGGTTDETDFPLTAGVYNTKGPGYDSFGDARFYSFVVKISPAGQLVYGTLLGTGSQVCTGGSGCIGRQGTSAQVDALAVDSAGEVTATESMSIGLGRISRLAPDASKLIRSTDTGMSGGGIGKLLMAQDASGAVTLLGQYAPVGFVQGLTGTPNLFAERLSASGALVYSMALGQASLDAAPLGIVLDTSGNAWVSGVDSSTAGALGGSIGNGADFVLEIGPTGTPIGTPLRFPAGAMVAGAALGAQQQLVIPGVNGAVLTLPAGYSAFTPAVVAFANAASFALNTGIFPGALVSLFGFGFPAGAASVTIGGYPATILYQGPNQINLQVPFEVSASNANPNTTVSIVFQTAALTFQAPVSRALGVFTVDGLHAAALNQDGTVNSAANPAVQGSIVTIYGTGAVWPSGVDGAIATGAAAFNQEQNGLEIADASGVPFFITYTGAAPGIIEGVFQINFQVPVGATPNFSLASLNRAAGIGSNAFSIYLK